MGKDYRKNRVRDQALTSELLILPDGSILVHNLTQPMADILRELNPKECVIGPRTRQGVACPSRPSPYAV